MQQRQQSQTWTPSAPLLPMTPRGTITTPQQKWNPPDRNPPPIVTTPGKQGIPGIQGETGLQGIPGIQGIPGEIDETRLVEIIRQVLAANPIDVVYMTLDEDGNEVESERTDQVTLGGTLRIPPHMLRIRQGDAEYTLGAELGASTKWFIE